MIPTVFAILVLLAGLAVPVSGLLHVVMMASLFGAAAAISLPALGGAVITPVVLVIPVILMRLLYAGKARAVLNQLNYPEPGFWLLMTAVWAMVSAYFLPRLLSGETMVRSLDRLSGESGVSFVPLHPVSMNLTQSAYAAGVVCAFAVISVLLSDRRGLNLFLNAVLVLAVMNCLAGLLNLIELYTSMPSLLQYVRTAYKIFVGGDVGGLQRISGTFSETSAFAAFTLPLLAFTFSLALNHYRPLFTGVLSGFLFALLMFSTSGTAYAGTAIYATLLFTGWIIKGDMPGNFLVLFLWGVACAVCYVLIFEPALAERVLAFFDAAVFNKLETESGQSRSSWNTQAWVNFVETYGLGVGVGSAYASSIVMVVISNLGIPGSLLFLLFLYKVLVTKKLECSGLNDTIGRASRHALLAALAAEAVSARVLYLGIAFYAFAAAAVQARLQSGMAGTGTEVRAGCSAQSMANVPWKLYQRREIEEKRTGLGVLR